MAEIVNLNKARKAKTKAASSAKADENRAKFGRTKAQKARDAAERAQVARLLDGAERE